MNMYRFVTFRDLSNFVTSKNTNKTAGSVSFSAQPVYLFSLWLYQERLFWFFRFSLCDRFEQKQSCGGILTNPPHVTPLRPGSTVIDGFSKLIPQRIAVEISYLLVYCSWKSINNCGAGTQWRNVWWIRQGTPKRLLLLGAVTFIDGFSKVVAQKIANR